MVIVEMTQADIDRGLTKSYTLDSLAIAIKRSVKQHYKRENVNVLIPAPHLAFINERLVYLPKICEVIIQASDNNKPLHPATFELDMPETFFDHDANPVS